MRIVITGGLGQVGRALQAELAGHELTIVDLPEIDVTNRAAAFQVITAAEPELVIHCAAYTNVDGCAKDPALAYQVNALGSQNVALACQAVGAEMMHLSTNEVFAGERPDGYEEWQPLNPVNSYGASKAAAEFLVRSILPRHYIVRIAWLVAPGGRNFIHAILKRAREQGEVRVVVDEVGNPTYSQDLAPALHQLLQTHQYGTYHLTNSGACSRWQFAHEILRCAGLSHIPNRPILTRDYPRASTPPPYAALKNIAAASLGITLRPWQDAVADYVAVYG